MNIVIFGGSFNPPHNGHLELLKAAEELNFVDKILILPSNIPPHKQIGADFADSTHRINMCKLLASYSQKAEVCSEEIDRGGKSYMIDTVCALKKKYEKDTFWLLVGGDMVATLGNWYKAEELLSMISVLAVGRNTVSDIDFFEKVSELKNIGTEVKILGTKTTPISSTDVRGAVKSGNVAYIPRKISEYIKVNNLYR